MSRNYKLEFGKHKGKTLSEIPLTYLDWLIGQDWLYESVKEKIENYLKTPSIQRELERELDQEEEEREY